MEKERKKKRKLGRGSQLDTIHEKISPSDREIGGSSHVERGRETHWPSGKVPRGRIIHHHVRIEWMRKKSSVAE